jgi:penicillin-binding protein 2
VIVGVGLQVELGEDPVGAGLDGLLADRQVPCDRRVRPSLGHRAQDVSLAVGQGDFLATPLQMAVAYAAIENGGRVVRPHLGVAVEDNSTGREIQKIDPGTARHVRLDPVARAAIMQGLHAAASAPGGTSADVFKGWNQRAFPVYGKTGTAQRNGHGDQSWYVCFVPNPSRPIVLAVTVEDGGFGAEAAAPIARVMLAQWFNQKKTFVAGRSHTR